MRELIISQSVSQLQVEVFWFVMPYCVMAGYPFQRTILPPSSGWSKDGCSMDLRNVGILPWNYRAFL